jgi:ribonuclease P protein component
MGGASRQTPVQRLRSRNQFQLVLEGSRVSATEHFALHRHAGAMPGMAPSELTDHWIGALIPKRWARRAVTRNLIRRQIYAVAHEQHECLAPAAYVVRLRAGFDREAFVSAQSTALRRHVRAELQRLMTTASSRTTRKVPSP